jgi:hypothetical protein
MYTDSMEKYAKRRNKQLKSKKAETAAPSPAMPMHEPKYDLDTLTRAEEIRRDASRHRAAMAEARKQRQRLSSVMDGVRIGRDKGEE